MIGTLLTKIKQQILSLSGIESCFIYPLPRAELTAPLVTLEVAGFSSGDDPATEELALNINIEARVVVDSLIENANICCQSMACNVANLAHLNNFGCSVSPARVSGISQDFFKPEFDAYVCWLVEWTHQIHLGSNVWLETGVSPHRLFVNEEELSNG